MTLDRVLQQVRPTSDSWAERMGFKNELERLEMICSAPHYKEDAVMRWMSEDGTRAGLVAILNQRRSVRPTKEGDQ